MVIRHVSSSRTARRVLASAGIVGLALGAAACGSDDGGSGGSGGEDQIGVSLIMYREDYDGKNPNEWPWWGQKLWDWDHTFLEVIAPYTKSQQIAVCPSAQKEIYYSRKDTRPTGANLGDGNQASHWQDSNAILISPDCFLDARQIGIMDPTSSSCQLGVVTSNDIAAMDAMGWNVNVDIFNNRGYAFNTAQVFALQGLAIVQVPEPATWAMLLSGFGFVGAAMRRRSRVTVTYA